MKQIFWLFSNIGLAVMILSIVCFTIVFKLMMQLFLDYIRIFTVIIIIIIVLAQYSSFYARKLQRVR